MRFSFRFKAEKIPLFWRNSFLSFVKLVFSHSDDFTVKFLDSNSPKPFSFALLMSNPKINGSWIIPGKESVKFVFSTSDVDLAVEFYNGFMRIQKSSKKVRFGVLYPMEIEPYGFKLNMKKTNSSYVVLQTLSPICVKTKDGVPVLPEGSLNTSPKPKNNFYKSENTSSNPESDLDGTSSSHVIYDDEEFRKALLYSIEIFDSLKAKRIRFLGFDGRKVVVKHFPSEESKKVGRPVKLICWSGKIHAEGDPEALNFVYLTGLGFRRAQGFGCLDIVKEM